MNDYTLDRDSYGELQYTRRKLIKERTFSPCKELTYSTYVKYDVSPSELRQQNVNYEDTDDSHIKKFDFDDLDKNYHIKPMPIVKTIEPPSNRTVRAEPRVNHNTDRPGTTTFRNEYKLRTGLSPDDELILNRILANTRPLDNAQKTQNTGVYPSYPEKNIPNTANVGDKTNPVQRNNNNNNGNLPQNNIGQQELAKPTKEGANPIQVDNKKTLVQDQKPGVQYYKRANNKDDHKLESNPEPRQTSPVEKNIRLAPEVKISPNANVANKSPNNATIGTTTTNLGTLQPSPTAQNATNKDVTNNLGNDLKPYTPTITTTTTTTYIPSTNKPTVTNTTTGTNNNNLTPCAPNIYINPLYTTKYVPSYHSPSNATATTEIIIPKDRNESPPASNLNPNGVPKSDQNNNTTVGLPDQFKATTAIDTTNKYNYTYKPSYKVNTFITTLNTTNQLPLLATPNDNISPGRVNSNDTLSVENRNTNLTNETKTRQNDSDPVNTLAKPTTTATVTPSGTARTTPTAATITATTVIPTIVTTTTVKGSEI